MAFFRPEGRNFFDFLTPQKHSKNCNSNKSQRASAKAEYTFRSRKAALKTNSNKSEHLAFARDDHYSMR